MTPTEAQAVTEIVDLVGSGGGLLVLGFVVAKLLPVAKQWLALMKTQEKLAKAQLAALGEDPAKVPKMAAEAAEDLRKIRASVEAHSAA